MTEPTTAPARVVSQLVEDGAGSTTRTDIDYQANRDSSPKFAEPQAAIVLGRSSLYTYDGLHRLSQADTGQLNDSRDDLLSEWTDPGQRVYTMDILGNITTLNLKNSGSDANETRTYNCTNEMTSRTINGEAARYWVNDDFADNDTAGWEVADLNAGDGDGTWAASSGTLACTGTISVSGAPDGETGSILLVDDAYYQDVYLTCDATLGAGCDNAGLVFGYRDRQNYWVKVYSKAQDSILLYQVSAGTWTQRSSNECPIGNDEEFTMTAEVRSGLADTYAGTVLAGQVGLWCGDSSANSLDDFKCRDIAGPFEVDGRYFCSRGQVRTDNSNNNALEAYATDGLEDVIVRRASRLGLYVATFKFTWNDDSSPGFLVRWLSPGDYLAIGIPASDDKPRLYKREADGALTVLATGSTSLGLTGSTQYEAKVVVSESGGNQLLNFYIDLNGDDDFVDANEHVFTDLGDVDDVWSAGQVGLYRGPGGSSAQLFDDVTVFVDNDSDGILDAADDVQLGDDFASNVMSLTYDNNGNLTDDGVLRYVYDAWNRLRKANRYESTSQDTTTIGAYEYYPDNRRSEKVVTSCGVEETAGDGGNTTVRYFYGGVAAGLSTGRWNIVETRNGSNQATRQWIWGTQYVDEPILMDVNGEPDVGNDCNPDVTTGPEAESGTADERYFYVQDRNWNVVALTGYDPTGEGGGDVVERYSYTPYGEFIVLNTATSELGNVLPTSTVGNPFAHQGLAFGHEKGSYQNRHREHVPRLQQFAQRDPSEYSTVLSRSLYAVECPLVAIDPFGEQPEVRIKEFKMSLQAAVLLLKTGGHGGSTTCYHCGWLDTFGECAAVPIPCRCPGGLPLWVAVVPANAKPFGIIESLRPKVELLPSQIPPELKKWLPAMVAEFERCVAAHEDEEVRIFKETYVPLSAIGIGAGCSEATACAVARESARLMLEIQKQIKLLWGRQEAARLNSLKHPLSLTNCMKPWFGKNPQPKPPPPQDPALTRARVTRGVDAYWRSPSLCRRSAAFQVAGVRG